MLTKARRILIRLLRQTPSEWRDLVEAEVAVTVAQLLLWFRPVGKFVTDVADISPGLQEPLSRKSKEWDEALRIAVAVRRAADYSVFKPKCLTRAIALSRMLENRGIKDSRIKVGVRRLDGKFTAHAWLELGQRVLGDDVQHVSSFAQLIDVKVVDNQLARSAAQDERQLAPIPSHTVPVSQPDSLEQEVPLYV
jgi:hypothetical protein